MTLGHIHVGPPGTHRTPPLRHDLRGGQVMIEHLLVATVLLATIAVFAVFFYTFKEYGGRILDLAGSEYP